MNAAPQPPTSPPGRDTPGDPPAWRIAFPSFSILALELVLATSSIVVCEPSRAVHFWLARGSGLVQRGLPRPAVQASALG